MKPHPLIADARALARTSGHDLENFDRAQYQSLRTRNGVVAPLPLTEAAAWNEAQKRTLVQRLQRGVVTNIRMRRRA